MTIKLRYSALALVMIIFVLSFMAEASGSKANSAQSWSEIPESPDDPQETANIESPKSPKDVVAPNESTSRTDSAKTPNKPGPKTDEITAIVRLIRANPETEVFFKDYKHSLIIPKDSHHNQLYEMCENSRKTGAPVKLSIDPIARRILSPSKASGNADGVSTP